jgi:23S rRNA-/tRNA-specific pseudouridylate synthase
MGKGWLVVEKTAGLTVHNEPGKDLCSLVRARIEKSRQASEMIRMDSGFGFHAVHRLDKETSGVVLLAVDSETFYFLSRQFETHQVKKKYQAILHGHVAGTEESGEWGVWNWPLAKTAGGRRYPQGTGVKQSSNTRYRVIGYGTHYTFMEIELMTGRKHQIRRHAKLAGHPVVGDSRYGSVKAVKYVREKQHFDRLALHACALAFKPPDSKEMKTIRSRELPRPIKDLLKADQAEVLSPGSIPME